MRPSLKISFFSSVIVLVATVSYYVLRIGFDQQYIFALYQLTGLSLLLLFLPDTFSFFLQKRSHWFWSEAMFPVYGLLFCVLLGWINLWLDLPISLPFTTAGYLFFLVHLFKAFGQSKKHYFYLLLPIAFFFSLWVIAIGWAKTPLKPTFIENFILAFEVGWNTWYGGDALFHFSMEQMIKNYGLPSTGLYGIPWMFYHYGMHAVFAFLAAFLQIPVYEVHNMGYVLWVMPLFFRTFLAFILELRRFLGYAHRLADRTFGYTFWLLFLCFFIQLFKDKYSGGQIGVSALISENFTLSMIFMFALFSVSLRFWEQKNDSSRFVFLFIYFPLFFALLGFMKISTIFVVLGLLSFLFLRLQLFFKAEFLIAFLWILLVFAGVYYATVETLPFGLRTFYKEGGDFEWFYFFKSPDFEPFTFFFFFFIWVYLFIFLLLYAEKINSPERFWQALRQKKSLAAEILLITTFSGILPTFALVSIPHNLMYFLAIQLFVSVSFLLAYLPFFAEALHPQMQKINTGVKKTLIAVLSMGIFFGLSTHVFWEMDLLLKTNLATRVILTGIDEDKQKKREDNKAHFQKLWATSTEWIGELKNAGKIKDSLQKNPLYNYISRLQELDRTIPANEKRKTLLYIDFSRNPLPWKIYCHTIAFVAPAYGGLGMINGALAGCIKGSFAYGYEYYLPLHQSPDKLNRSFTEKELCGFASKNGFQQILILDGSKKSWKKISCQ